MPENPTWNTACCPYFHSLGLTNSGRSSTTASTRVKEAHSQWVNRDGHWASLGSASSKKHQPCQLLMLIPFLEEKGQQQKFSGKPSSEAMRGRGGGGGTAWVYPFMLVIDQTGS